MEAKEMKKFKEVRKETKKATPYMTWNNKNFGEGTMSQGIFCLLYTSPSPRDRG